MNTEPGGDAAPGWTPADFILHGEFADAAHVRDLLDRVREAAGADFALLLAYQTPDFVPALRYYRHHDPAVERPLQAEFHRASFRSTARDALVEYLQEGVPADAVVWGDDAPLGAEAQHALAAVLPDAPPVRRLGYRPRPASEAEPASLVGVLCGRPSVPHGPAAARLMGDLAAAVYASAPMYLRRLHAREQPLRESLTAARGHLEQSLAAPAGGGLPPGPAAAGAAVGDFLGRVMDAIRATRGRVYVLRQDPRRLDPIAVVDHGIAPVREVDPVGVPPAWPDGPRRRRVEALALGQRRPFLFDSDESRRALADADVPTGPAPYAGMAVPMYAFRYRDQDAAFGVMVVEREGEPARPPEPFSQFEYWYAQEAAQCLARVYARGLDHVLTAAAADARRRWEAPRPAAADPADPAVPADLAAAAGDVADLLGLFRECVPAIAACSVRVLSARQDELPVLAAYGLPDDLRRRPVRFGPAPADGEESPIAAAVRTGARADGRAGTEYAPNLQSLSSVPLVVGRRCVGAVTFGSQYPEAFRTHEAAMRAVAEAVADVLQAAQGRVITDVLHRSARVFDNLHALEGLPTHGREAVDRLVAAAGWPPDPDRVTDVRVMFVTLAATLRAYQDARSPPAADDPGGGCPDPAVPVGALLERLLAETQAADRFDPPEFVPPAAADAPIDPRVAAVAVEAMRNLVANATRELTARNARGRVTVTERRVGGGRHVGVTLANPVHPPFAPGEFRTLYREPFQGSDGRTHFGAFLAGWQMRTVGGDVYLDDGDPATFRATTEIPLAAAGER